MRCLSIPEQINRYRIHRVGIEKNTIYVHLNTENTVEIWCMNTLLPNSWQPLVQFKLKEIDYTFPAFSYHTNHLYILIFGCFVGDDLPKCSIFRIERTTKEIKEYILDISSAEEFFHIPFEQAAFGVGTDNLHIYDRGVVMGPIKYWKITLIDNPSQCTFTIERDDIEDEETEAKCSRFPIELDAGNGVFARLRDDNCMFVSARNSSKWQQYLLSADSQINLAGLLTKGVHETYGRQGHRVAALESPMTVYSDGGIVIAKVTRNRSHFYYRIEIDNEKNEFSCISCGQASLTSAMDRMFYAMVSQHNIVVLGLNNIVVVDFQPMKLLESVIWSIERKTGKKDSIGAYSGGISLKQINNLCNYVNSLQTIV